MAGYLARYPAIWIGDWLSGGLIRRWLIYCLANWAVACSLAGCLAGWRTDWWGWQADYLGGPGDLEIWLATYMAICLAGKLSGWQSDWIKGYLAVLLDWLFG